MNATPPPPPPVVPAAKSDAPTPAPPSTRPGFKVARILFKGLMALLTLPILAVIAAGVVWRFEPAQQALLDRIHRMPAMEGIRFQGIGGELFGEIRLEKGQLLDAQGPWLTIEQASATLSWDHLAQGTVWLRQARAERITAHRPPLPDSPTVANPNVSGPPDHSPVVSSPNVSGPPDHSPVVSGPNVSGPPDHSPVVSSPTVSGPPDHSPATAPPAPVWSRFVPTRIVLEPLRVARLELGEPLLMAMPPAWRGQVASLPAAATVAIDWVQELVEITHLQASTPLLTLEGGLKVELAAERLHGAFQADLADIAPFFSAWSDPPPTGSATVAVNVSGPLSAPRTSVTLESPALTLQGHHAQGVTLALTIDPPPPSATPPARPWPEGVVLTAQGAIRSMQPAGYPTDLPRLHPAWKLKGDFRPNGSFHLERLEIDNTPEWSATVQGEWDGERRSGPITVTARSADLAKFRALLPWPLRGSAEAHLETRLEPTLRTFPFVARVQGRGIDGWPADIKPFLSEAPEIQARGTVRIGSGVELDSFALEGHKLALRGSGRMGWQDLKIQAKADLKLPDLGLLSEWTGKKLTGAANVTGEASGLWSSPRILLRAEAEPWSVEGHAFKKTVLRGDISDPLRKPAGHVELVITQPQGDLTLNTRYRVEERERIVLDALKITAPRTRLAGDLAGSWSQRRLTGRLKGEIEELAALKGWHGQNLGGRVSVDLALESARDGTPRGHIQAKVKNLSGAFGRMEELSLDARAGLERGKPGVEAEVAVTRWHHGSTGLETFKGRASGTLEKVAFSGAGQGKLRWPYTFATKGTLEQKGGKRILGIQELTGRLDKEAIKLIKPVVLTVTDQTLELTPWEATIGEASTQGSWRREGRRVEGSMRMRGDLALLNRLGLWPMGGKANLEVTLSGHEDRPDLTASATLSQGRSLSEGLKQLPPLNLTLRASAQEGRHPRIEAQARGFTPEEAQGMMVLPVRIFAHAPWVENDPNGEISGWTRAGIQLRDLGKWLGQDERQRMEGILMLDLAAGGTLAQPTIRGTTTLERGRFEWADSGTTLHDIQLRIQAVGESLVLESFNATDGAKGTVRGDGRLRLDPDQHFPLELNLQLSQAVLARRDDATATASGPIRVSGTLSAPRVQGELTIHRAEFHPTSGGAEEIQVVELDEPRPVSNAPSSGPALLSGGASVDLTVSIPGRAFIRGHGLDSEWSGDVRISGPASEPQVIGQLRVKRGHLDLLERRFQLSSGAVTFDGAWPPTPWIEMEATVHRGEIVTHVGLEGTVQRPRVKLTSDPSMSEEEILSHLLFDRATDSITPTQALKLALALKSMQGGGPGLLGSVQKELGIDRLDVGGDSVESGTVSAGKYLTDDIYLEVEKGLKSDSGRINVEVEMTPRLYLKTGVDAKSNGDIGVQWKKDY
ncbi:MAG: translocation/assembly module TamB domain-containing protein [Magnetococcales bacterium]|nr:translocation/assembly module TamB domain-containing protein [Magnetococcales bacterium]